MTEKIEKILKIEHKLRKLECGYEHGFITEKEFDELTLILVLELKVLASKL